MNRTSPPTPPDWFPAAIDAARQNYRRITVTKHTCSLCGTRVRACRNPILKRSPKDNTEIYTINLLPDAYAFCACAQWALHPGERSWETLARIYHTRIARPGSETHRAIMLRGYPTPGFITLLIGGDK